MHAWRRRADDRAVDHSPMSLIHDSTFTFSWCAYNSELYCNQFSDKQGSIIHTRNSLERRSIKCHGTCSCQVALWRMIWALIDMIKGGIIHNAFSEGTDLAWSWLMRLMRLRVKENIQMSSGVIVVSCSLHLMLSLSFFAVTRVWGFDFLSRDANCWWASGIDIIPGIETHVLFAACGIRHANVQ